MILIAISLPSIASVRQSAQRVVGLSNIRKLQQAVQMYVNNSREQFPATEDGRYYPTTGFSGEPSVAYPYWQIYETWTSVIFDELPYGENVGVFLSPGSPRLDDELASWPSSYGYATTFAGQPALWSGRSLLNPFAFRVGARQHQVPFPSAKVILWDRELGWEQSRPLNDVGDIVVETPTGMQDGSASLRTPAEATAPTPNIFEHAVSARKLFNTTDGVLGRDY
jgi:hypothetical protein